MHDDELIAGARGRSLCLWMLCGLSEPLARYVQELEYELGGRKGLDSVRIGSLRVSSDQLARLVAEIAAVDVAPLAAETDPLRLLVGVGDAVDGAMPWQPPFIRDALARFPEVHEALRPAAAAVVSAPAAQWWDTPIDLDRQYEMRDSTDAGATAGPTSPRPVLQVLADLREAATYTEELIRRQPKDPAKESGGAWWSIPTGWIPEKVSARLPSSSRSLPEIGAVELAAQEDSHGPQRIRLWRIQSTAPDPRIFEVRGPEDWARLVATYPFDVSRSRRGVWWESTGIDGAWFIPDWLAVAADFDAIHVSVYGYLTTAGEPIPVPGGNTVLAGWNPDCTYWLCDVQIALAEEWIRTSQDDMAHWTRRSRPTVSEPI